MLPDVHTYDALPLFGVAVAGFAAEATPAAAAEPDGKQKVVEQVLGDASGDDGALIGCVICMF